MKKNPGRKQRRYAAKKNRTFGGKIRMRLENWKRHFASYSRKNKRAHREHINELAKYHLIGNQRWKRLGKIKEAPAIVED